MVYDEVLRSLGSELDHVTLNPKKMRGLCVKGFFELYPNWGRVLPHLVLRKVPHPTRRVSSIAAQI
jgi:hypothetical protein